MLRTDKIKPLNGNILVCDQKKQEKTDSGIFIPGNAQEDHIIRGTIIETSPIKLKDGSSIPQEDVIKGDTVLYSFTAGAGNVFEEDENVYRVIKPIEILAKIVSK